MYRTWTKSTLALIALILSASITTFAVEPNPETFAGKDSMNGVRLSDFAGFERNWRLVTVRFRKDTGELRWTFANKLAWKTLEAGSVRYPDGAVFAKVGVATHEDSQFPSSMVPSGARRYQVMIRNSGRFKDTGGWGYALFDVNGKTFPEDPVKTSKACWACHTIVQNRGQIFSQPFQLAPWVKTSFFSSGKGFRTVHFDWMETSKLSNEIRKQFPADTKRVRIITDRFLRQNLFQGTLDEIRPSLELEAFDKHAPTALISYSEDRFSIVIPVRQTGCAAGHAFRSVTTGVTGDKAPRENNYCNP